MRVVFFQFTLHYSRSGNMENRKHPTFPFFFNYISVCMCYEKIIFVSTMKPWKYINLTFGNGRDKIKKFGHQKFSTGLNFHSMN